VAVACGVQDEHGEFRESDCWIPGVYWGAGIPAGTDLTQRYVSNKDIAPTLLNAIGLKPGPFMVGRILEELYA
jgi:arylsulfatase A-like enzyme